jgi:hypothetical protein
VHVDRTRTQKLPEFQDLRDDVKERQRVGIVAEATMMWVMKGAFDKRVAERDVCEGSNPLPGPLLWERAWVRGQLRKGVASKMFVKL